MADRLTQSGLHIASALTLAVYSHSGPCQEPTPHGCAYHLPGVLPAVTMDAGTLRIVVDPEPDPLGRPFGNPSRVWFGAEGVVIDFAEAIHGAHVVWLIDYLPAPHWICGGSHDVNFDGAEDIFDVMALSDWIGVADPRGDWNEDGQYDFFDLLDFMVGF